MKWCSKHEAVFGLPNWAAPGEEHWARLWEDAKQFRGSHHHERAGTAPATTPVDGDLGRYLLSGYLTSS